MLSKHLEYQVTLEQKGVVFGAGPMFQKGTDAPHRGMIIVQANSLEEALRKFRRRSHAHLGHARIYSGALAHERGRRHPMNVNDLLEIEDATGIVFQEHSARMTSEYVSRHRIKVGLVRLR